MRGHREEGAWTHKSKECFNQTVGWLVGGQGENYLKGERTNKAILVESQRDAKGRKKRTAVAGVGSGAPAYT